ncbi:MAG: leucine-rich repeat protein [Bacilli bacterium]
MKEKIPVKTFYLMAVIGIGLLGLAIGSTYAMFTASATIENPISFTSNLSYSSEVLESVDVTIAAGETKTITLNVVNSQTRNLKFASWYICNNDDVEVVATPAEGYSLSGTIAKSSQFAITVKIRNYGSSTAFVNLGVSSTISSGEIVLSSEMKLLEEGILTTLLSDFDYAIGSYDEYGINIPDGDILLVKYKGTDTSVNVPATYTVDGVTYNTVMYGDSPNYESTFLNSSVVKVNFKDGVKFADFDNEETLTYNSMTNLFAGCSSLTEVTGIPDTITNMYGTFSRCTGLMTAPEIPSSVTNMSNTFYGCTGLTTAPEIPSSVTVMTSTFYGCTGLTTAPEIPSSVTVMFSTFEGCTSLTTAPEILSSVTDMSYTFKGCTSLTTAPEIPSSVTDMTGTFQGCTGLTTAPEIPSSVTNMSHTFRGCTNLTGDVSILSSNVNIATYVFDGTTKEINVYVPEGSTTYTKFSSLTTSNGMPSNVTLNTVTSGS